MGISLSMDTFSLSLSLGTTKLSQKKAILMSTLIGIFHFCMPLIGNYLGNLLKKELFMNANFLTGCIFLFLAIQMYLERNNKEETRNLNIITILIIAFTVSIDSLTVGFAYGLNQEKIILASMIFMITSAFFTYLGCYLGNKLQNKFENQALLLGVVIMFLMAIKNFIRQ